MRRFAQVLLWSLCSAVLIAALCLWKMADALRLPLNISEPQRLIIAQGSTSTQLLRDWQAKGWLQAWPSWVPAEHLLRVFPHWSEIQAGTFALYPGDTLGNVLERSRSGDGLQLALRAVEGERFADLRARLEAHADLRPDTRGLAEAELIQLLGLKEESVLEGAFLPETYHFPVGSRVSSVLQRMHAAMQTALVEAWAQRQQAEALGSPFELLILASIIEKETGLAAERADISGVFHRRLHKGMRLQTDPTVIYGLGADFDGDLRRADLRRDTPWNTYTRHGLPPTPICLPGRESLLAAGRPADGSSLYFVANGEGGHVFSDTLQEHVAAVRRYQLGQR